MKVNHRSADDVKAAMTLLSEIKKETQNTRQHTGPLPSQAP